MQDVVQHYHHDEDCVEVRITRGMKDKYSWEIRVKGKTKAEVLEKVKDIDQTLRVGYGEGD